MPCTGGDVRCIACPTMSAIEQNVKKIVHDKTQISCETIEILDYEWGTSTMYSPNAYGKPPLD